MRMLIRTFVGRGRTCGLALLAWFGALNLQPADHDVGRFSAQEERDQWPKRLL
jgi:hypothetical protein